MHPFSGFKLGFKTGGSDFRGGSTILLCNLQTYKADFQGSAATWVSDELHAFTRMS